MGEIVSIITSPVIKGASDAIVSKIVAGAIGMSTNMIYQYHTATLDARGCMGCMKCKKDGKCFMNDKISEMIDHIRTADSIIISTPVFFDNVSWSLKMVMDRMFVLLDENYESRIPEGKELIIVVTYDKSLPPAKNVERHIRDFMVENFKCDHVGSIVVPFDINNPTDTIDDNLANAAYAYGNMLSIAIPLETNVTSLDETDVRRGGIMFPHGFVWTYADLLSARKRE